MNHNAENLHGFFPHGITMNILLQNTKNKMELELLRTYYPTGTNGNLLAVGIGLCHTIELPWKENQHQASCIPEGRYELVKRYSLKNKWHLLVKEVKPG